MKITMTGAVLFLSTLAACGGGSSDSGTTASTHTRPSCASVWVDGATIPDNYNGCRGDDGTIEAAASVDCKSGTVYTYEPAGSGFFTLPDTGRIVEAGEDYANDSRYPLSSDAC